MSASNYITCMSGKALNSGTLEAFYQFTGGSGNAIYNSLHSPAAHHHQSNLIGSKNPAIVIRSGSALGDVVTGKLGGSDVFNITDFHPSDAFTYILDMDANACIRTGVDSQVLISSFVNPTDTSGFAFGLNQANKLFFEHYDQTNSVTGIETLNLEVGSKATIFLGSPYSGAIDMGFWDYEVDAFRGRTFQIDGFSNSDKVYLGGMNHYSGVDHQGFSGNFNKLLYFTGYYSDVTKASCVDCLFSDGVTTENTTGNYNVFSVTGFEYSTPNTSGITGYTYSLVDVPHPTGGTTQIWRESGLSGVLSQGRAVTPLTGLVNTGEEITSQLNFNINYGSKQEYGIKEISFGEALTSGCFLEVYSYQKPQANFNIESQNFELNKSGYNTAQLYHNGLLNVEGLDYNISTGIFTGATTQGYDPSDAFNYNLQNEDFITTTFSGLWSGGRVLLNPATSGTGADYFPNTSQYPESGTDIYVTGISGTVVTGYDLFLNGQKLAEDYDYEVTTTGASPAIKLYGSHLPWFTSTNSLTGGGTGFVSGYPNYPPSGITNIESDILVFSQKTTGVTTNRYVNDVTGVVSSVFITGYSEQVWINGIKQYGFLYDKTYPCSPTSGKYVFPPSPFLFLNNEDTYLNIE